METYFKDNKYDNNNVEIIKKLFMNLYKTEKYKKILFVRTKSTLLILHLILFNY